MAIYDGVDLAVVERERVHFCPAQLDGAEKSTTLRNP